MRVIPVGIIPVGIIPNSWHHRHRESSLNTFLRQRAGVTVQHNERYRSPGGVLGTLELADKSVHFSMIVALSRVASYRIVCVSDGVGSRLGTNGRKILELCMSAKWRSNSSLCCTRQLRRAFPVGSAAELVLGLELLDHATQRARTRDPYTDDTHQDCRQVRSGGRQRSKRNDQDLRVRLPTHIGGRGNRHKSETDGRR